MCSRRNNKAYLIHNASKEIKEKLLQVIDENKELIFQIGDIIQSKPECGYKEEKTSMLVRRILKELEIDYTYPHALTGIKGRLKGKNSFSNVAVIGELDALKCQGSPITDNEGNAHACGHNAQLAALLGTAIAFSKSGVMSYLDGDVTFLATPAEEFIDMEYRKTLKEAGKIKYYGGKQQMISEGVFDDVDMAVMVHAQPEEPSAKLFLGGQNLGFLAKRITFRGKAVHGSTPFDGVNALNAAALSIIGMHSNRETFREDEKIRIHPIITKGGDVVNSVPDEVCIETYVRGASLSAIKKGNRSVERSVYGAAQMIGADVEIEDVPGYLPLKESRELSKVFEENAKELIGLDNLIYGKDITGSTDIGDLSCIMPVIQPSAGGFQGVLHSKNFKVADKEIAYILPAKILALTVAELLYNKAEKAKAVKLSFKPEMTKEAYLKYLEGEME